MTRGDRFQDVLDRLATSYEIVQEQPFEGLLSLIYSGTVEMNVADREWYADQIGRLSPSMIVDLCCGGGRITRHMSGLGLPIIGVDMSESLLASAKTKHPSGVYVRQNVLDLSHGLPPADVYLLGGLTLSLFDNEQRAILIERLVSGRTSPITIMFDYVPTQYGAPEQQIVSYRVQVPECDRGTGRVVLALDRDEALRTNTTRILYLPDRANDSDESREPVYFTSFEYATFDADELMTELLQSGFKVENHDVLHADETVENGPDHRIVLAKSC